MVRKQLYILYYLIIILLITYLFWSSGGCTHAAGCVCHWRSSEADTQDSRAVYSSSSERWSVWTMHSEPLEDQAETETERKRESQRVSERASEQEGGNSSDLQVASIHPVLTHSLSHRFECMPGLTSTGLCTNYTIYRNNSSILFINARGK